MFITSGSHVWDDHCNYYSLPSLGKLLAGTGAAAVLANTRLDADFREWYQRDVRSVQSNHVADAVRDFGDGWITIPAMAGTALVGKYFDEYRPLAVLGDFGERSSRAYLVGAPPMLLMQWVVGGGRPEYDQASHWRPFADAYGVSGHAFMSAVPFITAAKMSENPLAKGALYACSTVTGWSRINDDRHYLSQVWLGWWLAYVACDAVDATNRAERQISVAPVISPEMSGVGVTYEH